MGFEGRIIPNIQPETRKLMRIIISPAKKMIVDTDSFPINGLPVFLERTERLKTALQGMSPAKLQALWKCRDAIAERNIERLSNMDLRRRLTPAVLSYEGIQYQYMAPGVMETASWTISGNTCASCPASTACCGPLTASPPTGWKCRQSCR